MKMYDLRGAEIMDIQALSRNGDDLVMKGKIMGAMPVTVCSRPEEIIKALKMLSWSTICYMPIILIKGLWRVSFPKNNNPGAGKK